MLAASIEWKDTAVELPDADRTVLVGFADGETAHGYLDGDVWRSTEGPKFTEPVEFWSEAPQVPCRRETAGEIATLQRRVGVFMAVAFGPEWDTQKAERTHRFLEEALELAQACGCTRENALQLLEYVFGRPAGVVRQEVGGVSTTLAALCTAFDVDLNRAAEAAHEELWNKVDKIRAKFALSKPGSPLPGQLPEGGMVA